MALEMGAFFIRHKGRGYRSQQKTKKAIIKVFMFFLNPKIKIFLFGFLKETLTHSLWFVFGGSFWPVFRGRGPYLVVRG